MPKTRAERKKLVVSEKKFGNYFNYQHEETFSITFSALSGWR